jgi:TPR repeat protein
MSMRSIWRNGAQVPVKIVVNGAESKFSKGVTMARMVQIEDLVGSAAGGDEVAAFELAMCYASGSSGTGVDLVQAHRWFNVAAACGYRPALDWRHEIAMEMSAREVVEAQKLARATLGGMLRQAA